MLTLANSGNTWMTGVSLTKVVPTSFTINITEAGMATLCYEAPLDFTNSDVKAYTASLTNNNTVLCVLFHSV